MSESTEQQALIQWADLYAVEVPELRLLYAIPNQGGAGKQAIIRGQRMRKEGMKKGVPDLCLPVRRGAWNALYIEMKDVATGRLSPAQLDWMYMLTDAGNCCCVAHGFEAGRHALQEYLAINDIDDEGGAAKPWAGNGKPFRIIRAS
mgnify:FL=1